MLRFALALLALLGLAACGVDRTFDPQDKVDAARFVEGPPTYIVLYTGINDRNGSGAHSALLINASQRVLFDPAGTFIHPKAPIQNDVHFGITDSVLASFVDYHARDRKVQRDRAQALCLAADSRTDPAARARQRPGAQGAMRPVDLGHPARDSGV
jgi:hypothetical protein